MAGSSTVSAAPREGGWAAAIASARSSAASASALAVPRAAANPHEPPTRTRTPIPSLSEESTWSTDPFRVDRRSDWVLHEARVGVLRPRGSRPHKILKQVTHPGRQPTLIGQ